MTGYVRQSTAEIVPNEVVRASPLNAEFNAIVGAFNGTTGHNHEGGTGEGPKLRVAALGTWKRDAAVDPTASADSGQGYEIGSVWINVTADRAFICVDNSPSAAVWIPVTNRNALTPVNPNDLTTKAYVDALGTIQALPPQAGNSGRYLTTDGAIASWQAVPLPSQATETVAGVVELATNAEAQAGTDTVRAITPANLASVTATETRAGLAEIATQAEVNARTDSVRIVTPDKLATGLGLKGTDIASASTLTLPTVGDFFHVTGTTTITAISARDAGRIVTLRFAGALTLTHNGTSLILPGAANITTAANDVAQFVSEGSGNWRCVDYTRASGLVTASGLTMTTSRLLGRTTASTGAVEEISVGTGLALSGGSLANAFAAPGMVLIATATASNSATVDFTSLSTDFIDFWIAFRYVKPASNTVPLILRVNQGGSWLSSGYNSTYGLGGANDRTDGVTISNVVESATTNNVISGLIKVFSVPTNNGTLKHVVADTFHMQSTFPYRTVTGGALPSTGVVEGIRLLFTGGNNIAAGEFSLLGLRRNV